MKQLGCQLLRAILNIEVLEVLEGWEEQEGWYINKKKIEPDKKDTDWEKRKIREQGF